MEKAIIGKKVGMTQIFAENGAAIPVTVIDAGPCFVVQKKTPGYRRLQCSTRSVMKTSGKSWLQNPAPDTSKKQTCPQSGT